MAAWSSAFWRLAARARRCLARRHAARRRAADCRCTTARRARAYQRRALAPLAALWIEAMAARLVFTAICSVASTPLRRKISVLPN
eukprot:3933660-Pleurochrysis_carterae.AAC.2